jgi:hypothetical protein
MFSLDVLNSFFAQRYASLELNGRSLRDNFLHQMIDHHTRERIGQQPSLLDLSLVNDNENIVNAKYLDPLGSSDH